MCQNKTQNMIQPEEKLQLLELANQYKDYEKSLADIEAEQELLREKFLEVVRQIDNTKEQEIVLIQTLEEKYKKKFSANDLMEILNG